MNAFKYLDSHSLFSLSKIWYLSKLFLSLRCFGVYRSVCILPLRPSAFRQPQFLPSAKAREEEPVAVLILPPTGQVASFSFQSGKHGSSAADQVVHLGHRSNSKIGVEVGTVSKGEFQSPSVLYSLPCPGRAEVASLVHEWEGKGMGSLTDRPSMP